MVIAPACVGSVRSLALINVAAWHYGAGITTITAIITVVLSRETLLHIHILDILVHATDTDAVSDLHVDEALVAPPGAPRILDDPVLHSIRISVVAGENHTVVNGRRAIVICGKDTTRVPSPALAASRDRDTQRAILELVLDSLDVVLIASVANPAVVASL